MRKVFLREKKSAKKVFTEGGGINVMFKILYKSHSIMRGIFFEKSFSHGKKICQESFHRGGEN